MSGIRPASSPQPFLELLSSRPTFDSALGKWNTITLSHGREIATPASRRAAGTVATILYPLVRAVIALAEDKASARYHSGANPALVTTAKHRGNTEHVSFRPNDRAIVTTSLTQQTHAASGVLAVTLLVSRNQHFAPAYLAVLEAIKAGKSDDELFGLVATASDELAYAIENDLDIDTINWFYMADPDKGDMDEAKDPGALTLGPLFSDPVTLKQYLDGQSTPFDALNKVRGVAVPAEAITIDPTGFVGPQLDTAIRYMKAGRHILHHGPTGTGKSFVWDLAMKAIDPTFDPKDYPYFVHGSAGLEDIDFTGGYVLNEDGTRKWVDGPLVRAMKEGKRFKVEEMNRLPAAMLNVLLGAMDYGRITLPRHAGEQVNAEEGFAVDAMANIGREYTGTEEIDPAVMRRFTIKIEYDYLDPEIEVQLIRSRHPGVDARDAETLVRIATETRAAFETASGTMDVDMAASPAALLNCAEIMAEGTPLLDAIELTFLPDVAQSKEKRATVRGWIDTHMTNSTTKRSTTARTR